LVINVLLKVLNDCSTVQKLSSFFVTIKEELMIAPVVYVIVGSCGVALLRRSGDIPNVLRAVSRSEGSSFPRDNAGGFDSPTPHFLYLKS
jgi:hypothetical protein